MSFLNLTIPEDFNYENFIGIMKEITADRNYLGKSYFPERSIPGQETKASVWNDIRSIEINGFGNFGAESYNISKRDFTTKKVPLIPYNINHVFDMNDFVFRNNMGDMNAQKDIDMYIAEHVNDQRVIIDNTFEYLIWQMLIAKGVISIDVAARGLNYSFDFGCDSTQLYDRTGLATTKWTDDTGVAKPLDDIDEAKERIKKLGGGTPTEIIANSNAWSIFSSNATVSATFDDKLKYSNFTNAVQNGHTVRGLKAVVYDDGYVSSGTWTYYLPDNYVIVKVAGPLGRLDEGDSIIAPDSNSFLQVRGKYSYPVVQQDPATVKSVSGVTALPVLDARYGFCAIKIK